MINVFYIIFWMKKWGMNYYTKNETCFNLRFFRDTSVKVEKIVITENETKILKSYC